MSTPFIRLIGCLLVVSICLSPAAALAAPATTGETIHVVQWGETLILIADRYGVSVEAILAANGLADPNLIYVGQRLVIPAPGPAPMGGECATTYTVQWGDTLSGIAWQYQTTLNALMQANQLYSDFIYQGQRLCVPPAGAAWGPPVSGGPAPGSGPASGPGPGPAPGTGPTPGPGAAPQYTHYTVSPGDTLLGIAWHFGVSQAALMRANNLSNPDFLFVGQRLIIPGITPPAPRYQVAKIAFARWDGGKHVLYIANTDGSGEKVLLERASGPSWSPDGRSLSFYGSEGVDRQTLGAAPVVFEGISNGVLTVQVDYWPDDLSQVKLVQIKREGTARATAWAPNGKVIAWDANPGGDFRIYFFGEKGTDFEGQSAIEIPGEHPDWSPDGNRLVYRSGRDAKQGLWVSDRFDSFHERITDDGSDAFPRWSPDGQWIAFQREADGNVDIYLMPAPGAAHPQSGPPGPGGPGQPGGIRRLTDAAGPDTLPAWTPDGNIIFRSARGGSWAIYIMSGDGRGQQPIIPNADPGPDWTLGRMDVHPGN